MKKETVAEIGSRQLSAIIRTQDESLAREAMNAAVAGGFRTIEFTLTTPGALALIREFSQDRDLLVGAGTVLDVDDVRAAVAAGARFLVSPVTDKEVLEECEALDVVSIPGTYTPTEMMTAHDMGADLVKIFPAPHDLPKFVTQVRGPLPMLKLFPTAGVDEENFVATLAAGAYGLGFVSSLFLPRDLATRDYAAIEARAASIFGRLQRAGKLPFPAEGQ